MVGMAHPFVDILPERSCPALTGSHLCTTLVCVACLIFLMQEYNWPQHLDRINILTEINIYTGNKIWTNIHILYGVKFLTDNKYLHKHLSFLVSSEPEGNAMFTHNIEKVSGHPVETEVRNWSNRNDLFIEEKCKRKCLQGDKTNLILLNDFSYKDNLEAL